MSILQKDFDVTVTQGSYGTPGVPGVPAQAGFWTITKTYGTPHSDYVKPPVSSGASVSPVSTTTARFASHAELRMLWPTFVTNCAMMKRILYILRTTPRGGIPLYWLSSVQYIAIAMVSYGGRTGVGLCVVTGPVNIFTNPEYWGSSYSYHGEISGCP